MKYRYSSNTIQQKRRGFTLVEVIVAVGVIVTVLVAFMSALTKSLSNLQYARNKTLATKYAQEAIEFLRSERDQTEWSTFYSYSRELGAASEDETGYYCFNTFSSWPATPSECTTSDVGDRIPDTPFLRQVILTGNGPLPAADRVTVNVVVSWVQSGQTYNVTLNTYLTDWQ